MKKHNEVVGAIFIENGKLFAAKRGASKYPYVAYKYEFAGGKVEQGEDLKEALRRELREEMALDAEVNDLYMSVEHEYPDFSIRLNAFLCRMKGAYTLLEHQSAVWMTAEELREEDWAPADAPILAKIKEDMRSKKL